MKARETVGKIGNGCGLPPFKRWLVFNLVGGMGIVVQLAVLVALTGLMDWNYLVATAAAVEAAVLHNFFWHEHWTWAERAGGGTVSLLGRLARFHLTNGAFSLLGNILLMQFFVGRLSMNYTAANLSAITVCSILNFFAGDRVVFPARPPRPADQNRVEGGCDMSKPKLTSAIRLSLLVAALCVARGEVLRAAELKPATVAAWEAYVQATENRIRQELAQGHRFLASDFQSPRTAAADRAAICSGSIVVAKMESRDGNGSEISVPDGMIHHWRGGMFIPGVELSHVLARVENPTRDEIKQEDVLQSSVLDRGDGYLKLYLKLQRSKIVTVVYNTVHEVRYFRRPGDRAWSSSKTLKIAELSHPNSPEEREKPVGLDHGFLWRLNSYWRYEQVKGGVIVECESISLSRSIPSFLEFMIRRIIDKVARESMERTLGSMRDRILRSRLRNEA